MVLRFWPVQTSTVGHNQYYCIKQHPRCGVFLQKAASNFIVKKLQYPVAWLFSGTLGMSMPWMYLKNWVPDWHYNGTPIYPVVTWGTAAKKKLLFIAFIFTLLSSTSDAKLNPHWKKVTRQNFPELCALLVSFLSRVQIQTSFCVLLHNSKYNNLFFGAHIDQLWFSHTYIVSIWLFMKWILTRDITCWG